jgi:hypothetical protein
MRSSRKRLLGSDINWKIIYLENEKVVAEKLLLFKLLVIFMLLLFLLLLQAS